MPATRPNIIYIVCHDLGRHLGCYGADVPSPNLDRFATGGVTFTRAFCSSPACSPSRGCAMTGQYAHTNGLMGLVNRGWSLPEERRTIVDELNDAGYETAHFGMQHERYSAAANRYRVEGHRTESDTFAENAVADAVAYLESRAGSPTPFYLNVGTFEVHPSRWLATMPHNRLEHYDVDPPRDVYVPPFLPDVPAVREALGQFQGAIRFLDAQVQRLFDAVERAGHRDNTLVVFTTDHGIAAHRAKTTLYDRGTEITLLLQMPGTIGVAETHSHLIQNIDILPTLLEAAGVAIPPRVQGKSFWPLLTGGTYEPHPAIVTERNWHSAQYDPMRSVRTERFHYIRNFDEHPLRQWLPHEILRGPSAAAPTFDAVWPAMTEPRAAEELYDMTADPEEFTNLAGDERHGPVKRELAATLDDWMRRTDDPLLRGPIPDRLNPWPAASEGAARVR